LLYGNYYFHPAIIALAPLRARATTPGGSERLISFIFSSTRSATARESGLGESEQKWQRKEKNPGTHAAF